MKSNWTVGKRIGLGFGVVVFALGAVATWSILGFSGITADLDDAVDCNVLQAAIASYQVDHFNWANSVGDVLTDDGITEVAAQLDPAQCTFGEWYYGEGRRRAETLVPAAGQVLAAVEAPHRRLHDSAAAIAQVFQQADATLPTTLAEKETDLLKWGASIRDAFLGQQEDFSVQTDPTACAVGKWLRSDSARAVYERCGADLQQAWDRAEESHRGLHESVARIGSHGAAGKLAEARHKRGEVMSQWDQLAVDYFATLERGMQEVIDPAKGLAEQTQDIPAMVRWGDIDMVMNEGVIQPFLVARIALANIATSGFTPEEWAECQARIEESQEGLAGWLELIGDSEQLAETAHEVRRLAEEWATGVEPYRQAIEAEVAAEASLAAARRAYEEGTLPLLTETLGYFGSLRELANRDLAGMKEANALFASQTTPALREVQELLQQVADATQNAARERNESIQALARSSQTGVSLLSVLSGVAAVLVAFLIARSLVRVLRRVVTGLSEGADQVNGAAGQVASASQLLASGVGEQASSLQQTSSALEEMGAMTRTNATNAKQANELAGQASRAADAGDKTMAKLNDAMAGINRSSEEISKIIKVIEEIAFQTNLLALNAAVEAARAGEHGKGFAVVADEVRNLAQRAAEAARETTALIEDAAGRSREGVAVADEVGQALGAIVGDVGQVTELINGISTATEEQAQGVDQVNTAVTQMDKVTQQNAAGAEESASAAEELNAQAQAVKSMVNELVALVGGATHRPGPSGTAPADAAQEPEFAGGPGSATGF